MDIVNESASKILTAGNSLLVTPYPDFVITEENIKNVFSPAVEKITYKDEMVGLWVDPQLWDLPDIKGKTMQGIDDEFYAKMYSFKPQVTNQTVFNEAQKVGIKNPCYRYLKCFLIARNALLTGEVIRRSIVVYFQIGGEQQYCLNVTLSVGLKTEIRIYQTKLIPDAKFIVPKVTYFS